VAAGAVVVTAPDAEAPVASTLQLERAGDLLGAAAAAATPRDRTPPPARSDDRGASTAGAPFTTLREGVGCTGPDTVEARATAQLVQEQAGAALRAVGRDVAVGLQDTGTGIRCTTRSTRAYDSASVVKVAVVAALLVSARDAGRSLTAIETGWARAAVTRSDNEATSALWTRIGRGPGLRAFLGRAGMSNTVPGPGPRWGLTQITVEDELTLLRLVTRGGLLHPQDRVFLRELMTSVVPDQRWGVPVGAPRAAEVGNKNGWLARETRGWRVHSVGWVQDDDRTYDLVLLSDRNATFEVGVARLNRVARALHAALG
jgi:hypothetical protein